MTRRQSKKGASVRRYERTRVLVEGSPALSREIVCSIEQEGQGIEVLDEPREELVMVKVRETAQRSLFYLGEVLATTCRVRVGGSVGFGIVMGSDRCAAYELAVIDAAFASDGFGGREEAERMIAAEAERLERDERRKLGTRERTRVDFSTMDVEL